MAKEEIIPINDSLIAHRSDDDREQPLSEHLRNTAHLAEKFAAVFGSAKWGLASGLLHDDGKASEPFQRRIRGASIHVDHSTPGAKYAAVHLTASKVAGKLLPYCIAGHHSGLPDGNAGDDDTCLARRLALTDPGPGCLAAELPSEFESPPIPKPPADAERRAFSAVFLSEWSTPASWTLIFSTRSVFCSRKKATGEEEPRRYRHSNHCSMLT